MSTRNFALKLPKLLQLSPKVSLCSFQRKGKRKKNEKTKENKAKVATRIRVPAVVHCLFSCISSISGLKSGENVREFEETANLYLPQTLEGIAGSLKC